MSFLVAAALAVGALVMGPLFAHLLRRGRAPRCDFPPALLVTGVASVARRPGHFEDRLLLGLRVLLVTALAVLGATPLVRCSRLRVARNQGASVAMAIVLDDSLSMWAADRHGRSRWSQAMSSAQGLVASAREGDAFALVLAGRPARLLLGATIDLRAVRRALEQLVPSDRSTDLPVAVTIARASLQGLPQLEHRIVLLSDLGGRAPAPGTPPVMAPLTELRGPLSDCGIVRAQWQGHRVNAVVACSDLRAARRRKIELLDQNRVVDSAPLEASEGSQTISLKSEGPASSLEARLTGADDISRDDQAPVAAAEQVLQVGIVADPARASVATGGPTVIEQAINALASGALVRPMVTLPDEDSEFSRFSVLIVDDPPGISPEVRGALSAWIASGGVALGLLGPASESRVLGLSLEPFAGGEVRWEAVAATLGMDPKSLAWLGEEAKTLEHLLPKGRALLDTAKPPLARVAGRWNDGHAWLVSSNLGAGLVESVGLPASLDKSELALRPGFLALLDHVLNEGMRRKGPEQSGVGTVWVFPAASRVELRGPLGPVPCCDAMGQSEKGIALGIAGRYQIVLDGQPQTRIIRWEASEILERPFDLEPGSQAIVLGDVPERVEVSREVAFVALVLVALESLARLALGSRRTPWNAPEPAPRGRQRIRHFLVR